jgi:hypothetical protein
METKTKTCPRCKETKPVTEYRNQKTKPDGLNRVCKLCCKHYEQTAYNRNPKRYIERSVKSKQEKRQWVNEYKSATSCIKCGESRWWVIDFHHVNPAEKEYTISQMAGIFPDHRTLEEMAKCVTLCRNCHYEFHHLERTEKINLDEYLNNQQYGN